MTLKPLLVWLAGQARDPCQPFPSRVKSVLEAKQKGRGHPGVGWGPPRGPGGLAPPLLELQLLRALTANPH